MHAAAFSALRTAQRPNSRRACRCIAGIRRPLPRRNLHRSAIAYQIPTEPPTKANNKREVASETAKSALGRPGVQNGVTRPSEIEVGRSEVSGVENDAAVLGSRGAGSESPNNEDDLPGEGIPQAEAEKELLSQRRQARAGSGRLRPNRPRQSEGLPPVVVPAWFLKKNVKCIGDANLSTRTLTFSGKTGTNSNPDTKFSEVAQEVPQADISDTPEAQYSINIWVWREILNSIRAALALRPPPKIQTTSINRTATILQCPKDGGMHFLDLIVEMAAKREGADLIRLDADDIGVLVGSYADENLAWTHSKTAIIGYETQKLACRLEDPAKDYLVEQGYDEDDRAGISQMISSLASSLTEARSRDLDKKPDNTRPHVAPPKIINLISSTGSDSSDNAPKYEFWSPSGENSTRTKSTDQWNDLKAAAVLDALIGSADTKRMIVEGERSSDTVINTPIIVQVRDYKEMSDHPGGADLLKKLRAAINKRWFEGRSIILLGTTSSDEYNVSMSKPGIKTLQSDIIYGERRTIYVPPVSTPEQIGLFETDEKSQIRAINIRHVEDMIKTLAAGTLDFSTVTVDIENGLDNAIALSADLEASVWTYSRVHRLATTVHGLKDLPMIDGSVFTKALTLLNASDKVKFAHGAAEQRLEEGEFDVQLQDSQGPSKAFKEKIMKIHGGATSHEKKLLAGVIPPDLVHTSFADVRAPKETVEALKTLTSLSLIRPEAFSYGVLANDKIPGLLLYGPPGTGKTLLAKAVAKESGATVLEVSGAEVSDMYVGEGEKNVKAIFSLAKKLSPCVVFIDEADSLLGSRSSQSSQRSSHREVINQFLREWDGLEDLSAFIMVATNRPFDLDDAVLRRLPRRLLVDLPVEKDREEILKIHLKDEILHESVSLAALAKDTPFYSGSDLKNVSVAAAMACIREETEEATKYTGKESYAYPPKRILQKHHFDKAMDEISASISDDMSTLSAIRKFDQKYGDRRGRRKKASAMGFGGTTVPERDSEAARVRKLEN